MTGRGLRSPSFEAALAMVCAAILTSCTAEPPPAVPAQTGFVTARGDRLVDGRDEYRFLSLNVPNLHYIEDDMRFAQDMPFRWPNEFEVRDALDSIRQMGGRVVRIYALSVRKADDPPDMPRHVLGPGEYDPLAFEALDLVLDLARGKGIRVIIPLVDNWSWWGGVTEYAAFREKSREAFWSDPQLIDDFKRTVRFVLERVNTRNQVRYKDDPTILAWETGNELHCPHAWTSEIAAFIKGIDSNHLVIDGRHEQVLRQESIDDPNIDFVQTHHYENDPRDMIANIRRSAAMARGRKPYHVGEFGFLTTAGMTAVMDTIIEQGLAGGLVWSLRFHNRDGGFYWHSEPHGGDLFKAYHWPGFPTAEAYDETRLLRELRRRAFAIRGIRDPVRGEPAAPSLIAVDSGGLISWRGSAGASAYDIQRTETPEESWRTIASGVSDAAIQYRPLHADHTVVPGTSYRYRIVARNEAGKSAPSAPFGPVTMSHRTLVDELWNNSRMFISAGALEFRTSQSRRFKEDAHGLVGTKGAAVVYRTDGPMIGGRVWAFAESAGDHLLFSLSSDGLNFTPIDLRIDALASGDIRTYGYWQPIRYRIDEPPLGMQYLRMEFSASPVRVTRIEIEYGE
jgi:mannan endo-1,4-beta-mannosidase